MNRLYIQKKIKKRDLERNKIEKKRNDWLQALYLSLTIIFSILLSTLTSWHLTQVEITTIQGLIETNNHFQNILTHQQNQIERQIERNEINLERNEIGLERNEIDLEQNAIDLEQNKLLQNFLSDVIEIIATLESIIVDLIDRSE